MWDEDDNKWKSYQPLAKKMISDSNAVAIEKGLECCLAFAENCKTAPKTGGEVNFLHCIAFSNPYLGYWGGRPKGCGCPRGARGRDGGKGGGQGRGLVGTVQVPEGVPAVGHCCPPRHQRAGGGVGPLAGFWERVMSGRDLVRVSVKQAVRLVKTEIFHLYWGVKGMAIGDVREKE